MNRRTYLTAAGGGFAALVGGVAVADATRADLFADAELAWGQGAPATIERTVTRDTVELLSSGAVRERGHTEPFDAWARRECEAIAAHTVVSIVDDRLEPDLEGVGSGIRYLLFGPVVTVDHTVTRDRDGEVVSEPNVPVERVRAVAPRTLSVTVTLAGRSFTRRLPVGVGHGEIQYLDADLATCAEGSRVR
jgi:hypothetical protein